MTPDAILTLCTVLAVLLALSLTSIGADLVMIAALTFLLSCGVLDTRMALAGFANEGLITVGVLFIVATGAIGFSFAVPAFLYVREGWQERRT